MKTILISILLGAAVAGCSTTNAFIHLAPDYAELPVEDLRSVAASIESIVAEGSESFSLESTGGIVVDTPEIQQAVRTRAIRSTLLNELRDTGFAREQENGLVAIERSSAYKKATTSRQRDQEALIVMSENDNRWTIYEGLLKANDWPPRALSAIQETFFEARVPMLPPGQLHDEVAN